MRPLGDGQMNYADPLLPLAARRSAQADRDYHPDSMVALTNPVFLTSR
jgi:hypothetical protein